MNLGILIYTLVSGLLIFLLKETTSRNREIKFKVDGYLIQYGVVGRGKKEEDKLEEEKKDESVEFGSISWRESTHKNLNKLRSLQDRMSIV